MKNKRLLFCLTLMLVASLAVAGCPRPVPPVEVAPPEPIRLTFAHFAPPGTFPIVSMERWVDEVEKRTHGRVVIETFPGGILLTAGAMFDGVLVRTADIGASFLAVVPGRFPLMSGVDLAKWPSSVVASRVLWELYQEFKPEEFADFKVLHMYVSGPNYIQTINPVRSLEDLKGLELRSPGPGPGRALELLGAVPIGMPMPKLPEALAKGVVEGYLATTEVLKDLRFAEFVKYVTDWSVTTVAFAVVMNRDSWNALPEDVKKVMDELALEQAIWTGEYMDRRSEVAVEWAIAEMGLEVITLSPEEKRRWDQAVEPLLDGYLADMAARGLPGQEFLARLFELRDK
jgi:TRAP-type C4-dicarboxylate transport system substrate-binding protein